MAEATEGMSEGPAAATLALCIGVGGSCFVTRDLIGKPGGRYARGMRKRYVVTLTEAERDRLEDLVTAGTAPARKLAHARILLKADQGPGGPGWVDEAIAEAV